MFVQHVMISPVMTVDARATVSEALALLHGRLFRHLPVVRDGTLVGMVSDRDLQAARAGAAACDGVDARVEAIMHRDVVAATPRTSVEEASRLMLRHRIGALPVLDDGRLVGIVTQRDLLQMLVQVLEMIEPSARLELAVRAEADWGTGAADAFGSGWPTAPRVTVVGHGR